jgi:hypothetical protein
MEIQIWKSKQVEAILETIYHEGYHEGFGFIVVLQTLEFGGDICLRVYGRFPKPSLT